MPVVLRTQRTRDKQSSILYPLPYRKLKHFQCRFYRTPKVPEYTPNDVISIRMLRLFLMHKMQNVMQKQKVMCGKEHTYCVIYFAFCLKSNPDFVSILHSTMRDSKSSDICSISSGVYQKEYVYIKLYNVFFCVQE